MAKKIVLDAGHGLSTAGKRTPLGEREWSLNNAVALGIAKILKNYNVEVKRVDDITGKKDISLSERVKRTNKIMPDVFISIHHNAYQGKWGNHTGVEIYYNKARNKSEEKTLATEMIKKISSYTGLKNRNVKNENFAVLTCNKKILALLVEGGFMDSNIDHPVIISKKGQQAYAKAVAETLIKYLKLTKKTTIPQTTNSASRTYSLKQKTLGYYTSNDALKKANARATMLPGNYKIYNEYNGMINITKTSNQPGAWINPS